MKTSLCPFAQNKDCFARHSEMLGFDHKCKILNSNAFEKKNLEKWNGICPFYKSLQDFETGVRKHGWLKDENGNKIMYRRY